MKRMSWTEMGYMECSISRRQLIQKKRHMHTPAHICMNANTHSRNSSRAINEQCSKFSKFLNEYFRVFDTKTQTDTNLTRWRPPIRISKSNYVGSLILAFTSALLTVSHTSFLAKLINTKVDKPSCSGWSMESGFILVFRSLSAKKSPGLTRSRPIWTSWHPPRSCAR